jgi:hypothetical protein
MDLLKQGLTEGRGIDIERVDVEALKAEESSSAQRLLLTLLLGQGIAEGS